MNLRDRLKRVKKIKDSLPVDRIKKFFQHNEGKINRTINFTTVVLNDAHNILNGPNKPGLVSYASLAAKTKNNYDTYFRTSIWQRFAKKWEGVSEGIHQLVGEVLGSQFPDAVTSIKENNDDYRFLVIEDFVIGWKIDHQGDARDVFVEYGKYEELKRIFHKPFWEHFGNYVVLSAGLRNQLVFERDPQLEVIYSEKAIRLSQYFQKFMEKKISRSILFYGPPGTGKSNIVRAIAHGMKMRALKFNIVDFKKMNSTLVHSVVQMVNPDVIIIEDIDHAKLDNECQVLAIMETLNKSGKLLLATTNEVSTINHAVIRPGRFDELIEIDKFDDDVLMKIVNNDKEIFDLIKDFPIASTMELMKRVKVLGREDALKSVGDIQKRFENMKKNYNCSL